MGNDSDIFMNRLSVNQEFQGNFSYKYGMRKIDKELYIHNLGTNVQSYVASKNWNEYKREEFRNAYERYMDALKKDRLSADDFGNITDSKGELGNVDGDDYWYDNKGNRISGAEYRALSVRKQKKYRAFYANKEVATYVLTQPLFYRMLPNAFPKEKIIETSSTSLTPGKNLSF